MEQKTQQPPPIFKSKAPITIKFSKQQRPQRIHSMSRLQPPTLNTLPESLQKNGSFVAKKDYIQHQLFDHHIVQNNMKIHKELKRLHASFIHSKVPEFYAYHFMNRLLNASQQKIQHYISKQLEEIKNKGSFFHVISNSIKARQRCLKQLQKCIENLGNNQEDKVTKNVLKQEINHYRKLTGFVINHIKAWKAYLNEISPQLDFCIYVYHGEDYLIKLLNDCEFIFNSFLSKYLKFSYKNDPYIMRPYLDGKQSGKEVKYLDFFEFDEEAKVKYMIDLNFVAEERAKHLETKMNSKFDRIKEIEKIYGYKQSPLQSKAHRKTPSTGGRGKSREILEKRETIFNNFMTKNLQQSEKKLKLLEIAKNTQRMRKIRENFNSNLINPDALENEQDKVLRRSKVQINLFQQKLRFSQIQSKKKQYEPLNFQSDFQNLMRKKQLQVLRQGGGAVQNMDATKTQRSFKGIKIKDNISESRKFITKEEGINELEKVLNQLDTFSPQKLENFKLRKVNDPVNETVMKFNEGKLSKGRLISPQKNLIQQNEQVYINVRNQVITDIEKDLNQKAVQEQRKIRENEKIQQILQNKIDSQSLKIINNTKARKLEGRQELAKQFESPQLFGYEKSRVKNSQKLSYVEEELKKQMQLKWLRQVQQQLKRKTELNKLENIKVVQQKQLNKKVEKVLTKEQLQKRYEQIQKQERAKIIREQLELEKERKQQIQNQMRAILQRERAELQKLALHQRREAEEELKEKLKEQLLENVKKQNEKYYEDEQKLKELQKHGEDFKAQAKARIEKQYKIGHQFKQNRDREERLAKIRLVKQKLNEFDKLNSKKVGGQSASVENISKVNQNANDRFAGIDEASLRSKITEFPDLRQGIFPKYSVSGDVDKRKLREQFELELFAFRKAQTYENVEGNSQGKAYQPGNIPIKDFKSRIDKQIKEKEKEKMEEKSVVKIHEESQIKIYQTQNLTQAQKLFNKSQNFTIKQQQIGKVPKDSDDDQKFTRFSQPQNQKKVENHDEDELIRMKLGMTVQQYAVYKKKKIAISSKRDTQAQNLKKKALQQKQMIKVNSQYQKVGNFIAGAENSRQIIAGEPGLKSDNIEDILFDSASVANKEQHQDRSPTNNLNNEISQSIIEQIDYGGNDGKHIYQNQQKQEEQGKYQQKIKNSLTKRKKNEDLYVQESSEVKSRVISIIDRHFATSDEDQEGSSRKKKKSKRKISKKKKVVQEISEQSFSDSQQKQQKSPNKKLQKSQTKQQIQQSIKEPIEQKPKVTTIKTRQIPVASLSDFFIDHFQHLPKILKKVNIYKKQQLIKYLLEHSSFAILQYIKESVSIGLGIVLYNHNKIKYRSLNIIHLGSYDENDYLDLLLNVVRHCFKHDPCQQIALSIVYDKDEGDQLEFIKVFEKKFDPYGAIFEKKIFNTQFERKFVLRRNLGQAFKGIIISQFNTGNVQLSIHNIVIQSQNAQQVTYLTESDKYEEMGINVGYYGLVGHILSQKYDENSLALMIAKGTDKDAKMKQKSYASLAKLSLAIRKNKSFQYLQDNEMEQQTFNDIISLNLELLSKKQAVMSYPPEKIQQALKITYYAYKNDIQLSYDFYSQLLKVHLAKKNDDITEQYLCQYLRYTVTKKSRIISLKSSAYSTKVIVLPCKSNKYKIFVMSSQQYDGLFEKHQYDEANRIDLGIYLRILFGNKLQHEVAEYDHVWLPEINIKMNKNSIDIFNEFGKISKQSAIIKEQLNNSESEMESLFKNGIVRSKFNLTYTNYLGNSLILQPSHRDLLITPPFIFGILNMQIETAQEGSPIFVKRIDKYDLEDIKLVENKKVNND